MSSKIKSYGLFEGDSEIVLVYSNPSQKNFLDYQLKNCLKRIKKTQRIQFQNTANGVWYCRQHPNNKQATQMLLVSKQASSISVASSFLNKAVEIENTCSLPKQKQKLRGKIDDLVKLFNANTKVDALSSSVTELEGIIKGNVNKLVTNMSELETAERKSEIMAELSMQFERDSKALQQKTRKKKCLMKVLLIGGISFILGLVLYILFF